MHDPHTPEQLSIYILQDHDRGWVGKAACTGSGANFFPKQMGEHGVREAIATCRGCSVRVDCLKYALNNGIAHGIWGALTARGRRELNNALQYVNDTTRIEHQTAKWFQFYTTTLDRDPVRRTAQTLGISKATVYHHLRIDRIAREQTDEIINHSPTGRSGATSSTVSVQSRTDTTRGTQPVDPTGGIPRSTVSE